MSALDHSTHGIPNVERQIAESPLLYMQVMALLWKRSDNGEDPAEWRIDDQEQRGSVASAMHLVQVSQRNGLNIRRIDAATATLDSYIDWVEQNDPAVADV